MIGLRYDFNDSDVRKSIRKLQLLLGTEGLLTFLGTTVAPYLRERAEERFAMEGDDVTGPWAPLSDVTVAIREGTGFPGAHPINRRTGELEEWVTQGNYFAYPVAPNTAAMRFPGTQPSASVARKYQTAQRGKTSPTTPPRPVLGVNEKDLLFVTAALHAAIEVAGR